MKTILVTGGSGFIGSHFIRNFRINHQDFILINLDKLTYAGHLYNNLDVENNPRYHFYRGDIADTSLLEELFLKHRFQFVVNFAAESHVDRSILDSSDFIQTNIVGTSRLLNVFFRHYKNNLLPANSKFLQVSTDEVYGSLKTLEPSFTESTSIKPNSPYSASKASADMIVASYFHTHQVPINITRCSNNYGPNQFPEKLIPLVITNAMNQAPIPVYGDGQQVRDWLYVTDHCSAIDRVLFHGALGEVYNIGGNNQQTNLNIIRHILKILNQPETLITFVKDRLGHDRRYAVNNSKIKFELGWEPLFSFDKALVETVKWYQSNQSWLNSIKTKDYLSYYEKVYKK